MENQSARESRAGCALLAAALALGVAAMWPAFRPFPLTLDEHVAYWIAGDENPGSLWERSRDYAATPPLSSIVQRSSVALFGKSEWALRLPSAIGYLLGIVGVYAFARSWAGRVTAGAAALLLAAIPGVVVESRLARPYGITVGLAAWSLWITWRWAREPERTGWMLGWIAINAALLWTHYFNLPWIALQLFVLFGPRQVRLSVMSPAWTRGVLVIAALVTAAVPLLPAAVRLGTLRDFLNFRPVPPEWTELIGPFWWAGLPAGVLAALLFARGHFGTRSEGAGLLPLALMSAVPILVAAVASHCSWGAVGEPRYTLVYAPAAAALVARLLTLHGKAVASAAASIVAVFTVWLAAGDHPWSASKLEDYASRDWRELAAIVQRAGKPQEPIFVYSGLVEGRLFPIYCDDVFWNDYVGSRIGRFYIEAEHPRWSLPYWFDGSDLADHFRALLRTLPSRQRIWIAATTDIDPARDALRKFETILRAAGYREASRHDVRSATLRQYVSRGQGLEAGG